MQSLNEESKDSNTHVPASESQTGGTGDPDLSACYLSPRISLNRRSPNGASPASILKLAFISCQNPA
jgi:hypothetical protein